jgi:hypothetical protein
MSLVILFLPQGILPSLREWLEERRAPRAAHSGALSMAEMQSARQNALSDADVPVADDYVPTLKEPKTP